MNIPYIAIGAVVLLLIILFVVFAKNKKRKELSPLSSVAFACVIVGIVFGNNRLIGYGLMGLGIVLAIIDAFIKQKNPEY